MIRFLRSFELDRLSFWLGFIAGILLIWLLGRLRPWVARLFQSLRERSQLSKLGAATVTEIRLRNDLLRHSQGLHLASPLFSLDEISLTPRLLAPPALTEPGITPPSIDIAENILPPLPDAPELASFYGAPSFTALEALGGNAHLLIIGHSGSGKTVTLAKLCADIIQADQLPSNLKDSLPILLHAADITLPSSNPDDLLEPLVIAVAQICPSVPQARLEKFLPSAFSGGRTLLLLDGLDELPPADVTIYVEYIKNLLDHYPDTRLITTATPDFFDGLTAIGCVPLTLASWNDKQRREFINRWSDMWINHIGSMTKDTEALDPNLLNAWLTNDNSILSPLELTLKVWATYAGDLPGPHKTDWIEAYLQRVTVDIPKGRPALELLTRHAVNTRKPIFTLRDAQNWLAEIEPSPAPDAAPGVEVQNEDASWQPIDTERPKSSPQAPIRDSRVLPALIESGLLISHQNETLCFSHPFILSYLAACGFAENGGVKSMTKDSQWPVYLQTLGFLATKSPDADSFVRPYFEKSPEPLMRDIFTAARWLRYAPESASWRAHIMRQLARVMQNESYPMALRARALTALTLSGSSGVDTLFRQFLTSKDNALRQLGALGCGALQDSKSINDLISLLGQNHPNLRQAACLGLVAIGNQTALEAVAESLLNGDDELRQTAAEALANNIEEGHPTLKEGATLEDFLVRRAVVYGLRRVGQPWAIQTLERMQVSDEQWVVKDAAARVLDELAKPKVRLPKSMPDLTETPWLIAFAGERGIGISPGKPALDLLLLALKEGNEEQRLSALDYLARYGEANAIPVILEIYATQRGEVCEAAYNTLWHIAASGVQLPTLS